MKILENKKKIIGIVIIFFIIVLIIIYNIIQSKEDYIDFEEQNYESGNSIHTNEIEENEIIEKIVVHVDGQVNKPGVIELNEGARIIDAIREAGGTTEKADLSKVNLAYILSDAQKVYIPSIDDEEDESKFTIVSDGEYQSSQIVNEKIYININTANINELQKIPGIGESTAKKIVEYRKENGNFKSIEDIQNVSGIGTSKFNNIKSYIFVK